MMVLSLGGVGTATLNSSLNSRIFLIDRKLLVAIALLAGEAIAPLFQWHLTLMDSLAKKFYNLTNWSKITYCPIHLSIVKIF